jgi:neutral ceramidase
MKNVPTCLLALLLWGLLSGATWAQPAGWKAGVARAEITPKTPLWQAGYASRTHASEGTLHPLWAKALALQDAAGRRAVLVTADLLGLPKGVSDRVRQRLQEQTGLTKAQLLLNSSHTHSGPVLSNALIDIYDMNEAERQQVAAYTQQLENKLVALVGEALRNLAPATLSAANGVTRFQVNRRNNKEATLRQQTELKGPNDYAVPVLRVADAQGTLRALLFGYACHPTVLDLYQFSGDYAGFAQLELEKAYPGTTALFMQGAGADQNPLPRRTVPLAKQYGRELAAAVERVLSEPMRPLTAQLATAYSELDLPLSPPPPDADLQALLRDNAPYHQRWARRMLDARQQGLAPPASYPYPVQLWRLGEQALFSFGGELVVEYALEVKKRYGPEVFVLGYSNDVMGYIPSETILKEGGYEGNTSQMVYGQPGPWAPGIQQRILAEVEKLAAQLGLQRQE